MARTKKASTNNQQKRQTVKQKHQSSSIAESSASHETANVVAPKLSLADHAIETPSSGTNNVVNTKADNENPSLTSHISSTTIPNDEQVSGGEPIAHTDENIYFAGTIPDGRRVDESSSRKNEKNESTADESNVNDSSESTESTDDINITGVAVLTTDDSESFIIDLTESICEPQGNGESVKDQRSTTARPNSIRKPLKRLDNTATSRYDLAKERTSRGTPYIHNVSSSSHPIYLENEMKCSTEKKKRIAEEIKNGDHLKRVAFTSSQSTKVSTATKLESINQKWSAVKMPRFKDIHKKLFEQMESIDVTVRKREERMRAASSKKETKGSTVAKNDDTSTKSKKVVRKLDNNSQPNRSNIPQAGGSEPVNELPKAVVRSKSFRTIHPIVGVLQDNTSVFQFTASSDAKIVPLPSVKKTTENRSARRQQAYKARPVPKTQPQRASDRLKGVRLNRRFQLQMKYREEQQGL